jgi:hypothetical protein
METLIIERSIVVAAVADGTRVTVTEAVRRARHDSNNEGWGIQLQNIAEYLRTTNHV